MYFCRYSQAHRISFSTTFFFKLYHYTSVYTYWETMVWVWVLFIFCFILIENTFSSSCPPVRCRVRSNESHRAQVLERFSQAGFSLDLSAWAQMKSPLAVPEYLSLLVWGWKKPQNKLSRRNNHIYFHACKKVLKEQAFENK